MPRGRARVAVGGALAATRRALVKVRRNARVALKCRGGCGGEQAVGKAGSGGA